MKRVAKVLVACVALAGISATTSLAAGKGKSNPSNGGCPPGLAKKNPSCLPPGLVRNGFLPEGYRGEDFEWIEDFNLFNLIAPEDGQGYIQIGDILVQLDQETFEILQLFDLLGNILGE